MRLARTHLSMFTSSDRFIVLGIVVVLFFQCIVALLNPIDPRAGIKWPFVVYTVAMFSFATVFTAINLDFQSISYVDNREFNAGAGGELPPGPIGYSFLVYSEAISTVANVMFLFNECLADGLLVSHISKSVFQLFNVDHPLAISLLHYIWKELLGHHLPLSGVSRFFLYVLGPPQTNTDTLG